MIWLGELLIRKKRRFGRGRPEFRKRKHPGCSRDFLERGGTETEGTVERR